MVTIIKKINIHLMIMNNNTKNSINNNYNCLDFLLYLQIYVYIKYIYTIQYIYNTCIISQTSTSRLYNIYTNILFLKHQQLYNTLYIYNLYYILNINK